MSDDGAMRDMITIDLFGGEQARGLCAQVRDLYAEVYAEPPYHEGPDDVAAFSSRFAQHTRDRGFALAAAYDGTRLVGLAYVATLEAGRWWRGATEAPPADVQAVDKAALYELAVRSAYRGRGLAHRLADTVLSDRPERWAVLLVNPTAPARAIYQRWGWRPGGSVQPQPGWPVNDTMIRSLDAG